MTQPARDERPDYTVSASRVKTYKTCPAQFFYQYVEDLPGTKQPGGYGILGSMVHEAIETVLKEWPDERDRATLASRFKQEFYRIEEDGDYETQFVDDRLRSDGIDCLDVCARWLANQDLTIREVEAEAHFDITARGVKETAYGFLDLTTESGIVDWKTGRIREGTSEDELIQGSMYVGAYKHLYGEVPEQVQFVYLKEEKVRSLDPSQENWEQLLRWIRRLARAREEGDFPGKPESAPCYWCEHEGYCSYSPVGAGQVNDALDSQPEMWWSV